MTTNNIPKVCPAPWVSLAINVDKSFSLCCNTILNLSIGNWNDTSIKDALNSQGFQKYRDSFSEGKYGKECIDCTKLDSTTAESRSDEYISKFQFDSKKKSFELTDIKHLDLFLSNKCNFSCRTCGSYLSTGWNKDNKKLNEKTYNFFPPSKEQMKELLEVSKNLNSIYIAGGEPLICEETFMILESLSQHNNQCEIVINTNFSNLEYNKSNIFELAKKLPNLSLNISIDGIHTKGEYIRDGLDFKSFESNLKRISNTNIDITFIITVSLLNILDIEEVLDFLTSFNFTQKIQIEINHVSYPKYFNIQLLPKESKSLIQANLYSYLLKNKDTQGINLYSKKIVSLCKYLQISSNESSLEEFFSNTSRIDKVRGQNFKDTFPKTHQSFSKYLKS